MSIPRLAQLPQRIRLRKCLRLLPSKAVKVPAHKQNILAGIVVATSLNSMRDPSPKSGGSDFRGQQEAFGRRTKTRRMIALRAVCLGPSKALSGLAGLAPLELHRASCYFLLFRFSAIESLKPRCPAGWRASRIAAEPGPGSVLPSAPSAGSPKIPVAMSNPRI